MPPLEKPVAKTFSGSAHALLMRCRLSAFMKAMSSANIDAQPQHPPALNAHGLLESSVPPNWQVASVSVAAQQVVVGLQAVP